MLWDMELKEQRREGYIEGFIEGFLESKEEHQHLSLEERDFITINAIKHLMKKSGWPAQRVMDALMIPNDDQKRYATNCQLSLFS